MRKNQMKARLSQGQTALGAWLMELRSTAVAALLAEAGLDFLIIDMEHGPYTLETAAEIIRMARQVEITPLVRIPQLSREHVGRLLDAGAQGLMLPSVESVAAASEFVSYVKYPPIGKRGMTSGLGNTDFQWVNTAEYIEFINAELLVIIQIESKQGVDNLEALLDVPGVDVYFIGPEDLSISLGFAGQQDHPQVIEHIQSVIQRVGESGRFPGIHASDPDALTRYSEQGVRMITYASDIEFIYNSARAGVQALRGNKA